MSFDLAVAALTGSSLAVVSSAHCAVMCGPLAAATRLRNGAGASLSYFGGRLVTYTVLGAFAGGAGRALVLSPWARWAEALLSWGLALMLLVTAYTLLRPAAASTLLRVGLRPRTNRVGRLLARVADDPLLLGAATALLPCAVLFAALLAAAALGTAAGGAVAMSSFAVVTGLVVLGVSQLGALQTRSPRLKKLLGTGLLIGAAITLYRPIPLLRSDAPSCHDSGAHERGPSALPAVH